MESFKPIIMTSSFKLPWIMWITLALISLVFGSGLEGNQPLPPEPKVKVEGGIIVGSIHKMDDGENVLAFLGIPYAAPPVHELRFKEPKPVKSWTGERKSNGKMICLQLNHYILLKDYEKVEDAISGTEDCLYLNVYTPKLPEHSTNDLFDVIVYIHGGGFTYGTGNRYKPNHILAGTPKKRVLVTINYRLGPFGFLTTDDEVIPGNNGLKDQNAALQWVQRNIKQFGGDPNRVTIAGMSAGGASVHLHYLSNLSANLFIKGISLSATALCPWVIKPNPVTNAFKLGRELKCNITDSSSLLECLNGKDGIDILVMMQKIFFPWLFIPFSPFGPIVESKGNNRFLSGHPLDLLKAGNFLRVPWLVSNTSEEGLYPAAEFITDDSRMDYLKDHWMELAPYVFCYYNTIPKSQQDLASTYLLEHFQNQKMSEFEKRKTLVKLIGDRLYIYPILKTIKYQSRYAQVFYYRFSYRGVNSLSDHLITSQEKPNLGVGHGDDLAYILGCYFKNLAKNHEDKIIMDEMKSIWTTFSSVPTFQFVTLKAWMYVNFNDKTNINYLHVKSPTNISVVTDSYNSLGDYNFWEIFHIGFEARQS